MLAKAAFRLGHRPVVLAGSPDEPAAQICPDAIIGHWNDPDALKRFLGKADTIAFENEFVPRSAFEAAGIAADDSRFWPRLSAMYLLQDKLSQKRVLDELKIPTAPYRLWAGGDPSGLVLKWSRMGYDGKGIWFSGDLPKFLEGAKAAGAEVYAEQRVAFRRELAIVACRSRTGEFVSYPLVISEQDHGICRRVMGPATSLGVKPSLEIQAAAAARKLAERLDLVGAFAIEFFETEKGELWVNEIAPRVHNTGHYTQDAADSSQFENHWRAILGLPLGSTRTAPAFVMLNLVGGPAKPRLPVATAGANLHWYGKTEFRPGRKLGHLNARRESVDELPRAIAELEAIESDWKKN